MSLHPTESTEETEGTEDRVSDNEKRGAASAAKIAIRIATELPEGSVCVSPAGNWGSDRLDLVRTDGNSGDHREPHGHAAVVVEVVGRKEVLGLLGAPIDFGRGRTAVGGQRM